MELHHQKQLTPIQSTKFKSRTKSGGGGGGVNKFVGVRQRPSGRWVAEIKDTTQKIRMWLGTFETADEAARAYDEAACLLRGANTRTNFTATRRPAAGESPLATRIRKLLHHRKLSSDPSLPPPPSSRHQNPAFSPSRRQNPAFSPPAAATSAGGDSPTSSPSTTTAADSGGIFADEFEIGPSMAEASWAFDAMFNCFSEMGGGAEAAAEATEFERMKVERQISASLYAMNGVQEYFEAVQDLSSSFPASSFLDPVWELPPLLHFHGN